MLTAQTFYLELFQASWLFIPWTSLSSLKEEPIAAKFFAKYA